MDRINEIKNKGITKPQKTKQKWFQERLTKLLILAKLIKRSHKLSFSVMKRNHKSSATHSHLSRLSAKTDK